MHVGLVVYGGLDRTSGGYRYDRRLVARLRERGDEVTVLGLDGGSYPRNLAGGLSPALRERLAGPFDVLLQDELCHPSLAWANRRLDGDFPVVAVVHHLLASEPHPAPLARLYRAVERRYLGTVDGLVCNGETTLATVAGLLDGRGPGAGDGGRDSAGARDGDGGRDGSDGVGHGAAGGDGAAGRLPPSVVAPPAADHLGPGVGRATARERARRDPFRVAFVGTLTARKGLATLVEALARLPGDGPELVVVGGPGDPAYARRVRRRVADLGLAGSVAFAGRISDAALAGHLARSHLLAVPSTYEGFGVAYLEGMAFGLPAIATAAGGASEVVTDGETGLLVPPGDPAAVADAVDRLRADRDRLAEMAVAARGRYEAHPTWAETADRVRSFLVDLVADGTDRSRTEAGP